MKRKLWLHLLAVVMIVVMAIGLGVTAYATEGEDPDSGMNVHKAVNVQEDGTYIVDLEAFATGTVEFSEKVVPVDLILVLDVSGSMAENISEYRYDARTSQAYSYDTYGNNTYYYKHTDGNYYQVVRERTGTMGNRRYNLHFTVGSTTYYLSGTGITTTNPQTSGSNSTIWSGVLYTRTTVSSQTKIAALHTAVNNFIDVVASKNDETIAANNEIGKETTDADLSRVAIVKFAMNATKNNSSYAQYQNNIGNDTYRYSSSLTNANYSQVVKDMTVVKTEDLDKTYANGGWHPAVTQLNAAGATAVDYGMGYANAIYNAHHEDFTDRQTVIVMFTDGTPTYQSNFDGTVANSAISTSKTLKAAGVKVFSVAILEGADPSISPTDSASSNENKYLHAVSSNYPDASSYTSPGTRYTDPDTGKTPDYYFSASSADELSAIFTAIAQSSSGTTTQVGAQSVMKDIVSSSFTLPEGADTSTISVSIVPWDSTTHDWSKTISYTPAQWKTECLNHGAETAENVSVSISTDGKTVDILGFDYGAHFQAAKTPADDHDGVNDQTAKVVVHFPIQAKPSAVTGGSVATNGPKSGIYLNPDDENPIVAFTVPQVVFTPVTYVVDYVTSDTSTDTKASTIKLDYSGVLKNVEMIDDPSDDVLIGEKAVVSEGEEGFEYTIYKGRYGTISFGDDGVDVQRRYVRYAPTTMNWNDYDRIFIKGASATEDDKDVWTMLCVIPANSVFYEDTFVTQTKTAHYNDQDIEIVYTGINYDKDKWNTVGTEGKNPTYHAGDDMGWISGLADDSLYANDMAHMSNTAKAKASFTFSGTGVDIYSRTNGTTGTVSVSVKSAATDNESGKKVTKTKIIDTKAAAGDFFAIPVCTFTDLPYGQYTATITVTAGGQNEGRMTFYLDGVRVYNPIKPLEGDGNVIQMYGEKNLGAVFTEVRSLLGSGATASALYIDEHTVKETVTNVAAVEAAAQALAAAQDARDAFVESTYTPAKNKVSVEENALSSKYSALESATNIYESLSDQLDKTDPESPEYATLEAAVAEALAAVEAAQDAYDEQLAHYNEVIDGLNSDLAAAEAGLKDLDDVIVAKRAAYDEANDAVTLEYTTTDVAEYNKEGPKSEVLLEKNQQVAINVESGKYYYIGLRSLNGGEVTVQINGASKKLSHTVDLYYEATPASGTVITIKNTSDNILSVTKLRATGAGNTTDGTKLAPTEETLDYVRSMADMYVADYTGEVLTEEEANVTEPVTEEPGVTEEVVDGDDIVIENPESTETETAPAESEMTRILSSFFNFFRRR